MAERGGNNLSMHRRRISLEFSQGPRWRSKYDSSTRYPIGISDADIPFRLLLCFRKQLPEMRDAYVRKLSTKPTDNKIRVLEE
jgi:hypothetical protein